jgi:HEAT repeat protein
VRRTAAGLAAIVGLACLVAAPTPALAQRHRPVRGVEASEPSPDTPLDLRGRFGLDRIESLLARDEPGAVQRAIERARALGSPEALALIAPQRDPLAHVRTDSRAAIALVRTLAEHTDDTDARHALGAVLTLAAGGGRREDRSPAGGSDAERFELARGLAAMALAASHEAEANALLDSARETGGPVGRAATAALRAYPAQRARDEEAGADEARLALAATTGDLRGLDALTAQPLASPVPTMDAEKHRPTDGARAHLLEALATLGDTRALPLARAARHDESAQVRLAAARVLAAFGDSDAAAACADLVKDDATVKDGIELARAVGRSGASASTDRAARLDLLKAIAARLAASSDVDLRRACVDALGGFPAPEAVAAIAPFLADPALAVDAAEALARSPQKEAMTALLAFARSSTPEEKRLALRAATMRRALGEDAGEADGTTRGFLELASALAAGRSADDRAVARAYLVVLGRLAPNLALADAAAEVRRAVLAVSPFDRALVVHAAATDADPVVRALAYAQLENEAPELVATLELRRRLREGEVDAPLAARVLASRATTSDEPLLALLQASDPLVRREAVRGFARSTAPDRSGRLATLAQDEPDVEIRRAAIAGLVSQEERSAATADLLATSARLDPDPQCRALASGVHLADDTREVAWLHSDRRPGNVPYQALLVTTASVRAFAFDADGDALVLGVSAAPKQLRLAPRVPSYQPAAAQ